MSSNSIFYKIFISLFSYSFPKNKCFHTENKKSFNITLQKQIKEST